MEKCNFTEPGGKVATISSPDGYVYDLDGVVTKEKLDFMLRMRLSGRDRAHDYADKFGCEFHAGEKPWGIKADIHKASMEAAEEYGLGYDLVAGTNIAGFIKVADAMRAYGNV